MLTGALLAPEFKMAEKTPVKVIDPHVCRCCNASFKSNPLNLFGEKAKREKLVSLLEQLTGLNSVDGDELPSKICRNCYTRITQFSEFRDLCRKSRIEQEASVRLKRGTKTTESSSSVELREVKGGKHEARTLPESSVTQNLQTRFTLIYPKENVSDVVPQGKKSRILPKSLQPASTAEPSKGVLILAKSGLRNSEVCNLLYSYH